MKNSLKLAISLVLPLAAGFIGSIFTSPAIPVWYAALEKPVLSPPSWLFAPVWTTLYILMGVALYLVWRKPVETFSRERFWKWFGVWLFFIQLALNTLWSALFFGFRNPGAALVEIIFLWVAILATAAVFSRVSKPAAWLLAPYLLWVAFATYLNYALWALN